MGLNIQIKLKNIFESAVRAGSINAGFPGNDIQTTC